MQLPQTAVHTYCATFMGPLFYAKTGIFDISRYKVELYVMDINHSIIRSNIVSNSDPLQVLV